MSRQVVDMKYSHRCAPPCPGRNLTPFWSTPSHFGLWANLTALFWECQHPLESILEILSDPFGDFYIIKCARVDDVLVPPEASFYTLPCHVQKCLEGVRSRRSGTEHRQSFGCMTIYEGLAQVRPLSWDWKNHLNGKIQTNFDHIGLCNNRLWAIWPLVKHVP